MSWKIDLHNAIAQDDFEAFLEWLDDSQVKKLLPITEDWTEGQEPLHRAAADGKLHYIQALIRARIKVNSYTTKGMQVYYKWG